MNALYVHSRRMFASLAIRNYRLFFFGQGLSSIGTWMQIVALGWLVLVLTGSGTQLGAVLAFRFFPLLIGGPFGGIPADYFDKRKVLIVTQSALALVALIFSALVFTETMALWMIYVLALAIGAIGVVDNPIRQTFIHEMVGPEHLRNAISLNSIVGNVARAVGPMIAGSLIAGIGIAACFFANALSFLVVIAMLVLIRPQELREDTMSKRQARFFLDGLRYAVATPLALRILITMAVIGTFAYEFQVSLPLLAERVFTSGVSGYAVLLSAMGIGSVFGGLFSAARQRIAAHEFVLSALLFGISICATAFMPTLFLATAGMFFVGFFSINLISIGSTSLQLASAPEVRAHIMSLWTMAVHGTTFIGAPLVGFIAEHAGARWGLAIGGIGTMAAAAYAAMNVLARDQLPVIPFIVRLRTEQEKDIEAPKV